MIMRHAVPLAILDALPALLGGPKVRPSGPPPWPLPDEQVLAALQAAFTTGDWGRYHGSQVNALEQELAQFHGVPYALTCASGSLAVEIALRCLNVGPGTDVILAAYEFESTFLTIHALGARPVLVDVASDNWNLEPSTLERALTPQTRAIVCSHLHGGVVPMPRVRAFADACGVGVVEDAAQATGATVWGRPAGTWGDVGVLSFGGSKLLSAGRGGALLVTNPALHQRAKRLLARGIQQWAPLSELQAAVIRPQLARLRERNRLRAERVQALSETLRECELPGVRLFENPPSHPGEEIIPSYYKLGFQYDEATFGLPRPLFLAAMKAEGFAFDAGFRALHLNRSPSRFVAPSALTQAARAHAGCVTLHHPLLLASPAEVDEVAIALVKVYRNRNRFPRL